MVLVSALTPAETKVNMTKGYRAKLSETFEPSKERELSDLQRLCPVHKIRKIEGRDVISNDNVGVNLLNKVSPTLQHFTFIFEGQNVRSNYVRACTEGEDVANERLKLSYDINKMPSAGCRKTGPPWRVTILAIWITGSVCASGKIPFLPAHSMSKLRIRSGAILDQRPSGACEMK